MHTELAGVWAAVLTPLTEDLAPDTHRLTAHLERLFNEGCDGAVLFGTTGEATSFSVDERRQTLEAVLAKGIDPDRVIVGVGCAAPPDTVNLTRHAGRLGVAGVLMLPPFYYKGLGDADLAGAFEWIFEQVGETTAPVLLYNIPQVSGVAVSDGLAARLLATHPHLVCGIKDSSGSPDSLRAFLTAMPGAAVFAGNELLLSPGLSEGAVGTISAPANVNAHTIRALFDSGGSDRASLAALRAFRTELGDYPVIPALKAVLAVRLDDPGWRRVRPPFTAPPPDSGARLHAALGSALPAFGV